MSKSVCATVVVGGSYANRTWLHNPANISSIKPSCSNEPFSTAAKVQVYFIGVSACVHCVQSCRNRRGAALTQHPSRIRVAFEPRWLCAPRTKQTSACTTWVLALHACTTCLHYMLALHACTTCLHHMFALHACTTCFALHVLHYMIVLHACTTCLHYMFALHVLHYMHALHVCSPQNGNTDCCS